MSGWNLPPGCSVNDIDRAAGACDDDEPTCVHGMHQRHEITKHSKAGMLGMIVGTGQWCDGPTHAFTAETDEF